MPDKYENNEILDQQIPDKYMQFSWRQHVVRASVWVFADTWDVLTLLLGHPMSFVIRPSIHEDDTGEGWHGEVPIQNGKIHWRNTDTSWEPITVISIF